VKVSPLEGGRPEQALAWTDDRFGHEVDVDLVHAGIPWLRPGRGVPVLRWAGVSFIAAGTFVLTRTPYGG
jgi:hypothetical protein